MKKALTCVLLLAGLATVANADWLPNKTNYNVYDDQGTHIGTLQVSTSGNVLNYTDDPTTNHPPDTGGSWAKDEASGTYCDGQGNCVGFSSEGGGDYSWSKTDSEGEVVDSGSAEGGNGGNQV